jgi:hypothetical protein
MTDLSPLAQEVMRVYNSETKWIGDKMPRPRYKAIANVLRTIVKHYHEEDEMRRYMSLDSLLSVADELDAASQGEFND